MRSRPLAIGLVLGLVVFGCSSSDGGDSPATTATATVAAPGSTGVSPVVPRENWPTHGADLANTRAGVSEKVIGRDNVARLEPAWRIDGLDGVSTAPIVSNGVLYIGDWRGKVHAINADSGAKIWETTVSPDLVGDTSVKGGESAGMELALSAGFPVAGAVAVDESSVYAGDLNGMVHALDRNSGNIKWSIEADPHIWASVMSPLVIAEGTLIAAIGCLETAIPVAEYTCRGGVLGIEPSTGKKLWHVYTVENNESSGAGGSVWSSPALDPDRNLVFFGTGQSYEEPAGPMTDSLIAIDYSSGKLVWFKQFTRGDVYSELRRIGPESDVIGPNLFTIDGKDVVGVGDKGGSYHVLDRGSGQDIWNKKLTAASRSGGVMASATYHDGVVYVASNTLGDTATFPGGDTSLYALDARTGNEIWKKVVEKLTYDPVTWANGVLYYSDMAGNLLAFDAKDGSKLWSFELTKEEFITGGATVVNGTLYKGYGWWMFRKPPEPKGGLIAFRPGG